MIPARPFPVLNPPPGCPRFVAWASLDVEHANLIHGLALTMLARCGGLTPTEIFGNVRRVPPRDYATIDPAAALDLVARIAVNGNS
jgi:hypothetical protein